MNKFGVGEEPEVTTHNDTWVGDELDTIEAISDECNLSHDDAMLHWIAAGETPNAES